MSDLPANAKPKPAAGVPANLHWVLSDRALHALYAPHPPPTLLPHDGKHQLYDLLAREIGDVPLTYLEFGVHTGWSIRAMASRFKDPAARFVGFDSFEGLPEPWGDFGAGHFSTGGATPAAPDPRVSFVKGWFQDSVPGFLATLAPAGPVLVHFDADLYSSTLFLMSTLWHHIPDYYFLFDEFVPSEVVAMYDFVRAYPVTFAFSAAVISKASRPVQVFGRLSRTTLQPLRSSAPGDRGVIA
jgi:hypothetical protein